MVNSQFPAHDESHGKLHDHLNLPEVIDFLAAEILTMAFSLRASAAEWVVIGTSTRYQTIRSWGAPSGLIGNPDDLLDLLLEELANTLGLTRLRFEPPRREWEDTVNDDADPFQLNPDPF